MYGQTFPPRNEPLKGVILILVGIGLVLGLGLVGAELINPFQGAANYKRSLVETNRADQQNQIDLENYEAIKKKNTEVELQHLENEIYFQKQQQELAIAQGKEQSALEIEAKRKELELAYNTAQEQAAMQLAYEKRISDLKILAFQAALATLILGIAAVSCFAIYKLSSLQRIKNRRSEVEISRARLLEQLSRQLAIIAMSVNGNCNHAMANHADAYTIWDSPTARKNHPQNLLCTRTGGWDEEEK